LIISSYDEVIVEEKTAYQVAKSPHARVPARWLSFLFRVAQLKGGHTYMLSVTIPEKPDSEPTWAVMMAAKVENDR
jgi:hypothetical protein